MMSIYYKRENKKVFEKTTQKLLRTNQKLLRTTQKLLKTTQKNTQNYSKILRNYSEITKNYFINIFKLIYLYLKIFFHLKI